MTKFRMLRIGRATAGSAGVMILSAVTATAQVVPPSGYIYSAQLLSSPTQGCVAAGPGGTFVAIGPAFKANAQAIVLAKESGELRLVAFGFNSVGDCAYDRASDTLYVSDNADNGDFGITGPPAQFAAQTGDTIFAIPNASTASGLMAKGLELLPANSVPFAASVAVDASGNVYVADAAGGGLGSVLKIVGGVPSTFASGFDYAAGIGINASHVFLAETDSFFASVIRKYTPAGVPVPPVPFAGPSYAFGSADLVFDKDGQLLASGAFGGPVVAFDPNTAASATFITGLNYAGGMTVDPFTGRLEVLSSTFSDPPVAEDKSLHRFTPVTALAAGGGSPLTDCVHEAYGLQVVNDVAACTDGAPCDHDGKQNDACLFRLGFCFNVTDPGLPSCVPGSPVAQAAVAAKPATAAVSEAAQRIAAALPVTGPTCIFSDGYRLPVKVTGSGAKKPAKATIKVAVKRADNVKDTDTYKLVCNPAP